MLTSAPLLALLILSCSVAADATAVAIAASVRGITFARGAAMAASFGAAQSIMAAIGWAGGSLLERWQSWDHWVALAVLAAVGIKMIREALEDDEERHAGDGVAVLFLLTLATSIDSLAVGLSLPTLGTPMAVSLAMIGVVTFAFSAAGAAFGRYLGERFGRIIEIAGGLGLIAIGISIVVNDARG